MSTPLRIAAVSMCAGLTLTLGCGGQPASKTTALPKETGAASMPAESSLASADTATVETALVLSSQLYVEHDATIYARSVGIVEAILVDLGSHVTSGQLLARLESVDQRIALDQAQERLTNSRQVVERQRELKTAGVVTQADSERVESEYREALLAAKKAERDLELTRITAPFAGVVTGRQARPHRLVEAGDTLFRVTALAPILAAVHVPEASAAGLPVGTVAEVTGVTGITSKARIIRSSPTIDPASGTREVVLQLSKPRGFSPGSSVTVRLGSLPRQMVTIPRSAVNGDGYALVWSEDRTTLRPLTLGNDVPGNRVEVVAGLEPGEKVVLKGP
jgi:membrane fusion protein, multidrug efflux system